MSRRLLGETFDIHGGGLDLVFPHHENEIAQSECCHGKPMVKYWMHNGLMRAAAAGKVGGRTEREATEAADATVDTKISRSKGAGGLADLIARFGGETIRFFLLRTHYRSTIEYSERAWRRPRRAWTALLVLRTLSADHGPELLRVDADRPTSGRRTGCGRRPAVDGSGPAAGGLLAKMDDDFNTGGAISDCSNCSGAEQVRRPAATGGPGGPHGSRAGQLPARRRHAPRTAAVLGLFRSAPPAKAGGDLELLNKLMGLLVELRADARKRKDFATADRIRQALARWASRSKTARTERRGGSMP